MLRYHVSPDASHAAARLAPPPEAGLLAFLNRRLLMLEFEAVRMQFPADCNIIIGQSHFIKTVEDIYEAVVGTVPQAKFGLAFNESSGPCLVRVEGNDDELRTAAIRNAQALASGHAFVLIVRNAYPVNLLGALRNVPEICSIFCATANPVEVVIARSEQGRGIMGVIDGESPKGVEGPSDASARRDFLRKIGYKK
ncbi:MAG: adenosine-specific kinase [Terriglobales bacterium]